MTGSIANEGVAMTSSVADDGGADAGSQPDAGQLAPWFERVRLDDRGLFPVIAQDATTRCVLMLAWMNVEALRRTVTTRRATYWSRSRNAYWVKGETSGHTQYVQEVRLDCDGDTVLLLVDQEGTACHTGRKTCFDADLLLGQQW